MIRKRKSHRIKSSIKRMREFYEISQSDLSTYLEISRSYLTMMELEDRNEQALPGDKIQFLNRYINAIPYSWNDEIDFLDDAVSNTNFSQTGEIKNAALERYEELKSKTSWITQKALIKMKKEYERSNLVLSVISLLKEKAAFEGEHLIIRVIEIKAQEVLEKNGEGTQLKLLSRLIGIKAEMDFLEKFLKEE